MHVMYWTQEQVTNGTKCQDILQILKIICAQLPIKDISAFLLVMSNWFCRVCNMVCFCFLTIKQFWLQQRTGVASALYNPTAHRKKCAATDLLSRGDRWRILALICKKMMWSTRRSVAPVNRWRILLLIYKKGDMIHSFLLDIFLSGMFPLHSHPPGLNQK